MTIEELQHKMEDKLNEFEKKLDNVVSSVDKLTNALLGDQFGNAGYNKRMQSVEDRLNLFEKFTDKLKYERVIATTIGTVIGALLTIAAQFLKH
jgi:hypothetical protein